MRKPKKRIFRISGSLVLISILAFLLTGMALAEQKHWIGGQSDWNTAGNWDPNGVPVKGDAVLINTQGDVVSYNNPRNPTLRSLQINDPTGNNPFPTMFQNALTLTTEKTEIGLDSGRSFYDHQGGVHRILIGSIYNNTDPDKGNLHLGVGAGTYGIYDLQSAVLSVAGHEKVGIGGEGFLNQMSGATQNGAGPTLQCTPPDNPPPVTPPPPIDPLHTIGKNLYLGLLEGSYGQFNIDAGSLTVGGSIRVGVQGTGQFNHTDSAVTVKGNDPEPLENGLQLAVSSRSSDRRMKTRTTPSLECSAPKGPGLIVGLNNFGEYNLTGGTLKVTFSEIIGWGAGSDGSRFIQKFGTHKVSGNLYIARYPDTESYNYYNFYGTSIYDGQDLPANADKGLLDVGGFASVGHLGFGEFYQDGGTVKVRGSDSELTNLSLRTASSSGTPSLQCSTGQRQYIGLTVGRGGLGAYYLTAGELLVSRGEAIGVFDGSDGAFYQTSGSHYVGGALTVALLPGSKGSYELYDGLLVARGGLVNNGAFNIYGGVLQAKVTNNGTFLAGKPAEPLPGQTGPALVGDFYNRENARLTLNDSKVKFGTNFYNSGILESSRVSFPTFKNLTVNESGFLNLSTDEITVTGNFTNKSTKPAAWNTDLAALVFSGAGNHYFKTGNDASGDWEANFGWGALQIKEGEGAKVRLQGHLYAQEISGITADANLNITNLFGFCGIKIFYEPGLSPDITEGLKLFTPWGKQVGHFTAGGFVQDCH